MKLLDLTKKISLVASPVDMRCGWKSVSTMAASYLNIDVTEGKVIGADTKGTYVLSRRLCDGYFQRLMTRIENSQAEALSVQELECYLDGERIQKKSFLKEESRRTFVVSLLLRFRKQKTVIPVLYLE